MEARFPRPTPKGDTMSKTLTIRGQKVRSASQRRFIVVRCRPADVEGRRWDYRVQDYVPETFKAFRPEIMRRSDDAQVALRHARQLGHPTGGWTVVIDTVSGEEL